MKLRSFVSITPNSASSGVLETVTSVLSPAGRSIGSSSETAAPHAVEKDPGVRPWPYRTD